LKYAGFEVVQRVKWLNDEGFEVGQIVKWLLNDARFNINQIAK